MRAGKRRSGLLRPTCSRANEVGGLVVDNLAADRALGYLLSARNWWGWWLDFRLAPGSSDEWVTAYVAATLAGGPNGSGHDAALDAWTRLTGRCRADGSWGYNRLTPGDADSTSHVLLLAQRLGL